MTKRIALTAFASVLILGGSLDAHHSYGAYQTDQTVSVEGTVTKVYYVNPHVLVTIKTKDGDYDAEFPAMRSLQQGNFKMTSLKVGDVVVATGCPMKDHDVHRMSLMKELRRSSDGWVWSSVQPKSAN